MQDGSITQLGQSYDPSERVQPLQPIAKIDDHASAAPARPATKTDAAAKTDDSGKDPSHVVELIADDQRALEIRYSLDNVTNVWVASVLDSKTGEVVRTVPARRVLHQLAELGHSPHVDKHA